MLFMDYIQWGFLKMTDHYFWIQPGAIFKTYDDRKGVVITKPFEDQSRGLSFVGRYYDDGIPVLLACDSVTPDSLTISFTKEQAEELLLEIESILLPEHKELSRVCTILKKIL